MQPAVIVRRPDADDAARVAEFLNAHALAVNGEEAPDADEVATWFALPDTEVWIAESPDDEIVAYADLAERAERTRYWLDLRRHPDERHAGAARGLLATAEAHARDRSRPGAVLRGVTSSQDETMRSLYEAEGYRLVRHSLTMETDFAGEVPEPVWPRGVTIRTFVPGADDERVYAAEQESFADHWDFERASFGEWNARTGPGRDPSLWFLAEDGEALAGICLCRVHPSGDPEFGYVSTLAVRRPWRRRGLGLALLHHAFRAFAERGMTKASLGVDAENLTGAVGLYERAGMRVTHRSDTYEKAL